MAGSPSSRCRAARRAEFNAARLRRRLTITGLDLRPRSWRSRRASPGGCAACLAAAGKAASSPSSSVFRLKRRQRRAHALMESERARRQDRAGPGEGDMTSRHAETRGRQLEECMQSPRCERQLGGQGGGALRLRRGRCVPCALHRKHGGGAGWQRVRYGAQDCSAHEQGAYTGEVSVGDAARVRLPLRHRGSPSAAPVPPRAISWWPTRRRRRWRVRRDADRAGETWRRTRSRPDRSVVKRQFAVDPHARALHRRDRGGL